MRAALILTLSQSDKPGLRIGSNYRYNIYLVSIHTDIFSTCRRISANAANRRAQRSSPKPRPGWREDPAGGAAEGRKIERFRFVSHQNWSRYAPKLISVHENLINNYGQGFPLALRGAKIEENHFVEPSLSEKFENIFFFIRHFHAEKLNGHPHWPAQIHTMYATTYSLLKYLKITM